MHKIEAFLKLDIQGKGSQHTGQLQEEIERFIQVKQVMLVTNSATFQDAELNFCYPGDVKVLDSIIANIRKKGIEVRKVFLHLIPIVGGSRDPYGASAIAGDLTGSLKEVAGISDATIGSNGIVRLELNPSHDHPDSVVQKVTDILQAMDQ